MDRVLTLYSELPSQFRETPPITGDMSKDLFGFQSANIQATLQLLRMVLLSVEEIGVERKCDVAGELLSVFSNVPVEYLKAINSPLVYLLPAIHVEQVLRVLASSPWRYWLHPRLCHGGKLVRSILHPGSHFTVRAIHSPVAVYTSISD